MDGHAMTFGDAAGPQVYHTFKLTFQDELGGKLGKFGPTRQPFPNYAVGHQLEISGELRTIAMVQHRVIPKSAPDDWVLQTTVIVR